MFRHVVLMRWKPEATAGEQAAVVDGLRELPGLIREIRSYSIGTDARINEGNFDLVVVADFDDVDGLPRIPRPPRSPGGDPGTDPAHPRRARRGPIRRCDLIARAPAALPCPHERVAGAGAVVPERGRRDAALPRDERGARHARERRQRGRRRARREPRARRGHAVHVRRRRRPARDRVGRRRAGVPRRGTRAGGATLDAVREHSGSETMPTFGPHACTVPGAVDGWFTLLERWGTRSFGEVSAARAALRERRLPGHPPGCVLLRRQRGDVGALRAARLHQRVRPVRSRFAGSASPRSRARCRCSPTTGPTRTTAGRSAPRSPSACSRRAASTTAAGPRRARGRVGRAAARDGARHRDPRDAAADPGGHRAGGAAHRPRPRPRRRRARPRAPPDRGDEARARRPRRVRGRAVGDDDRRVTRCSPTSGSPTRRAAIDPDARAGVRAAAHPAGRHHLHEHRRPRRAPREPHPVELLRCRMRAAGRRVGHQPAQPRLGLQLRRRARERVRAGQDAVAHADPGARAARRPAVAGVRERGRARPGADPPPAADADAGRRRRSAGRDHRAALPGRSRDVPRRRSRTSSTRRGSTTCAGAATRSTSSGTTGTVPASRTRSSASSSGYRAGSDPRAEGGVAGSVAARCRDLRRPYASGRAWLPRRRPKQVASTIPNVISLVRLRVRPAVPLAALGRRPGGRRRVAGRRCSARPTGSTATSPAASTRAASSARSSTRSPTACCWSRPRSRCSRRASRSRSTSSSGSCSSARC